MAKIARTLYLQLVLLFLYFLLTILVCELVVEPVPRVRGARRGKGKEGRGGEEEEGGGGEERKVKGEGGGNEGSEYTCHVSQ